MQVYMEQCNFENVVLNVPKRRHIVMKFGTSVDRINMPIFREKMFDTFPQTFQYPLNFSYHYSQWDRKFHLHTT